MRSIETILSEIQQFTPSEDYQNYSGDRRLRDLLNEAAQSPDSAKAVPLILELISRFPETYFHFGYLVAALETCHNYEAATIQAAKVWPNPLNILAINHLRSREGFDKEELKRIIEATMEHPKASLKTQELARSILKARPIDEILQDFESFTPTSNDYNYQGREQVWILCNELLNTPKPALAIPVILRLLERYPDADFGTPGILVHTLEELPAYEPMLLDSIHRSPVALTVEMLGRIFNSAKTDAAKSSYLKMLEAIASNPAANQPARETAQIFIDYHHGKSQQDKS